MPTASGNAGLKVALPVAPTLCAGCAVPSNVTVTSPCGVARLGAWAATVIVNVTDWP